MSKKRSSQGFVLDTFAIFTYMKEEAGWQKVRDLLWSSYKREMTVYLSYVSLGEFYYIAYREYGAVAADRAVAMVKLWPLKFINVNEDMALIAGRIKAENKISYADAFVAAAALLKKAKIITGDSEFKSLEDLIDIYWLPKNR